MIESRVKIQTTRGNFSNLQKNVVMQTAIMPEERGFNKPCYWLILTKSLIPRNSLWLVYDLSDLETSMDVNMRNKIGQEIKILNFTSSPSRISIKIIRFITYLLPCIYSLSLSLDHPIASIVHLKSLLMHSQNFSIFRIWIYIYIYSTRFPFSTIQFIYRCREPSLYADRYAGVPGDERTSETVSIRYRRREREREKERGIEAEKKRNGRRRRRESAEIVEIAKS